MTKKKHIVVMLVAILMGLMTLVDSANAQINTTITFSEFPANTPITTQYADQGIVFGGNSPSIISDILPNGVATLVLAPNNGILFEGTITGTFVDPSDGVTPIVVDSFSLDAGAFNYIGTTQLQWFDADGNVIGSALNTIGIDEAINPSLLGVETFTVTDGNIASWEMSLFALGGDDAFDRYAIDNVIFDIDECSLGVVPDGANCNAPSAVNDVAQTVQNTPLVIDVLDNDTDPDGDDLFITAVTASENGGATAIQVDDTILYTPPADYFGVDTFTYSISDGDNTDSATVTVSVSTVTASNDPPVAVDDSATVDQDDSVTIDVLANDSDPNGDDLEITAVSIPENGSALIVGDSISYTPNADFSGDDSFTYTISDGSLTATATVDVTVNPVIVNDAPIAVADLVAGNENSALVIDVLNNDSDPNGDVLTVTSVTEPTNGSVLINADNTVTYTPDADYVGVDTFDYTISDGDLADTTTVTITVNAVTELATLNISKVTTPAESVLPWNFTVSDVNQNQVAAFTLDTNLNDATFAAVETLTLAPGTYTVSETNLPDNWDLTDIYCDVGSIFQADEAAATLTVTLTEGSETNCTFENERQPEIRVLKYEDANNNGVRDPGEIGLSGVMITVSAFVGGPEPTVAQQTTDELGTAIFSNLVPNTVYTVCETVPEGYVNTQPGTIPNELGQVCQDILVSYGEIIPVYFGNYLIPADTPDLACLTFQPDAQSLWYEETPNFVLQVGNCDTGVDPYEAIAVDALVCQIPAGIQIDTESTVISGYFTSAMAETSADGQVLTFTDLQAPNADDGVLPVGQFFNVSFRGDISEAPLSSQLLCTLTVNGNQDDDATFDLTVRTPENPNPVIEETTEEPSVEIAELQAVEPEITLEPIVVEPTPNMPFNALSVCWAEDQNNATSVWQVTNPNDAPLLQGEQTKVMFDWAAYTVDGEAETLVQSAVRYDQTGEVHVNTALADRLVVRYYLWDNGGTGMVTIIEALADEATRCEGLPEMTPEPESTAQPEATEVVPELEMTVPEVTEEAETEMDVETETAPQPDPAPETTPEAEVTEPAPEATEQSQ